MHHISIQHTCMLTHYWTKNSKFCTQIPTCMYCMVALRHCCSTLETNSTYSDGNQIVEAVKCHLYVHKMKGLPGFLSNWQKAVPLVLN